ncbi:oligosaccharide MFS transporter [Levilactobacillus parabrevis]|uniref:oligosaccharide MFS transporter n=1 Tax=Levilactobacillus parabrevis TaxID=357278 RepID=UPI003756E64F
MKDNINLKQEIRNPSYLQSATTLFLYFSSWGIWWAFFQIWLTNTLHMSGTQVGEIFSANSIITVILMTVYGGIQDKLDIKRGLLLVCSLTSVLVGPFFIFVYGPLLKNSFLVGLILGSLLLSMGFLAATAVYEALSERISRRTHFEYGHARMFGSLGYAVSAIFAGLIFSINPDLNFIASSVLSLILFLELKYWYPDKEIKKEVNNSSPSIKDMFHVLKRLDVWKMIIFVMLSWTFYTVFDQQMFPGFYTKLFATPNAGERIYGLLNSLEVFGESIMMIVIPYVMKKIGVRKTLLLGVTVMFIRIGGCGVAKSIITISLVKMLHSIEVPLFMLAIIRYFTLHYDVKLSATLYMVGFQIAAQVGQIILSTPLGILRDNLGYRSTFLFVAAIVFIAVIFGFFFIEKDDQNVGGDPLS